MSVSTLIEEAEAAVREKEAENAKRTEELKLKNEKLQKVAEAFYYDKEKAQTQLAAIEALDDDVPQEKKDAAVRKVQERMKEVQEREQKTLAPIQEEIREGTEELNSLRTEIRELRAKAEIYRELEG